MGLPLTTFPNRKNFDYIFARHQNGFLVNVTAAAEVFSKLTDFDTREAIMASASENRRVDATREPVSPREEDRRRRATAPAAKGSSASAKLTKQTTIGWMRAFKESNLTMLTANAMEMKGLGLSIDPDGADDEASAMVRALLPHVPRAELCRVAELGFLDAAGAKDAKDAETMSMLFEPANRSSDASDGAVAFDVDDVRGDGARGGAVDDGGDGRRRRRPSSLDSTVSSRWSVDCCKAPGKTIKIRQRRFSRRR